MNPETSSSQTEKSLPDLQPLIESNQLMQWMYQKIRPFVKGKIMEIGSGEGNISELFVKDGLALRISDRHRQNCDLLKAKFENETIIKGVHRIDLYDPEFEVNFEGKQGQFDTVISMNIRERNVYNPLIWNNAKKLLREGGRLIILLPAQIVLYEEGNEGVEEWRRWNLKSIRDLLGRNGKIINFFSLSRNPRSPIFKNEMTSGEKSLNLYGKYVPSFLLTEQTATYSSGLYIISTIKK